MSYPGAHSFASPRRTHTASMAVGRSLQSPPQSTPPPKLVPLYPEAYNTSPRHDFGRRRTESRYIKEPGRSRIKISHRRGSDYHTQNTYSPQQFIQTLDPKLFDPESINHQSPIYENLPSPEAVDPHEHEEGSPHLHSEDLEDKDERSFPLSFGFSFDFFDPYEKSQESFAQTSLTSLGRGRIRGSKGIVGDESKTYRESIIDVSSSRYVNISDPGQSCGAELILQPPAGESERSLQPLLSWIHLEGKTPTFDTFLAYVASVTGLADEEQYKARKLLEDVKEQHEKPLHTFEGMRATYVEAVCISAGVGDDEKDEPPMILLCLPYFELAPLFGKSPSQNSRIHQLRTLLQYSSTHTSTSNSKDLQQAVCHFDSTPKGHCYHVSYLWCLFIGNDLLITCTNLSPPDIQQNNITSQIASDTQSAQEPQIHVSYGNNRVFLIAVKECTTWVEFVAHFRLLSTDFCNDYEVVFQDAVQDPEKWGSMIELARKKTIHLSLRFKWARRQGRDRWASRSSSTSSDASGDDSDGEGLSSISGSQHHKKQDVNHDSKSLDTRQHKSSGANLPKPDCDGIQTASINDPHIFFRAFVVKKPKVPTKGMEEAENAADFAKESQSTNPPETFQYDMKKLQKTFVDMDKCLRSKNFSMFSHEYKKCPSRTLQEAETRSLQILQEGEKSFEKAESGSKQGENLNSTAPNSDDVNSGKKHIHSHTDHSDSDTVSIDTRIEYPKRQKMFLKKAKMVFRFFLPLEYRSTLAAKYWGAVYGLIEDRRRFTHGSYSSDSSEADVLDPLNSLDADVLDPLDTLTSELTQGKAPPPWRMKVPNVLGDAWMHLIMFFVLHLNKDSSRKALDERNRFIRAMSRGREQILQSLAPQPLRELEAVLPLGIASLVVNNLVNHGVPVINNLVNHGVPNQPNVASTYSEYLNRLEHDFEANPYSRVHQEKLLRFRDEISCIQKVQQDQLEGMVDLQDLAWPLEKYGRSTEGYDYTILSNCISSTTDRISSFEDMNTRAIQLGDYNIQRIEANKDRQEAAILVFTVVTIIFLPLSFISSLFGMNTYDIRNMNTKQWLFWVTAVPVTVLVMGLAVVAVLNFDPVRGLWARIVERDSRQREGREGPGQGVDGGLVAPQRRPTIPYGTPLPPQRRTTTQIEMALSPQRRPTNGIQMSPPPPPRGSPRV